MIRYWIYLLLLTGLLVACQPAVDDVPIPATAETLPPSPSPTVTPSPQPTASQVPTATATAAPLPRQTKTAPPMSALGSAVTAVPRTGVSGVWRSLGYGLLLKFGEEQLEWYQVTAVSCLPDGRSEWNGEQFRYGERWVTPVLEGGELLLPLHSDETIRAEPLAELPDRCSERSGPNDPEFNFEVLWHTFDENYSLFEQYNVDWQQVYATFRPQVTSETTADELFEIFSQMLAPLQDVHVRLVADQRQFSPWPSPGWMNRPPEFRALVEEYYLDEGWQSAGSERLLWGTIDGDVGYLALQQLDTFGAEGLGEDVALVEIMDTIASSFRRLSAVVIDLRLSSEGRNSYARTIAGYFAGERRLAYSVHTRDGATFTGLDDFYIEPNGNRQGTGQVFLLTSRLTGEAAEILVMSLSPFPYVTVIGEPTSGSQSGMMERQLPNGWTVTLSNQVTYGPSGVVYESIGFPPNIFLPIDPDTYEAADPMLDEVLRQVEGRD